MFLFYFLNNSVLNTNPVYIKSTNNINTQLANTSFILIANFKELATMALYHDLFYTHKKKKKKS
jgi:hypothetical protein